jgi:hypothetical protein
LILDAVAKSIDRQQARKSLLKQGDQGLFWHLWIVP